MKLEKNKKRKIFTVLTTLIISLSLMTGLNMTNDKEIRKTNEFNDTPIALKSNISNMKLQGYVGKIVKNNVKYWQYNAYNDNPNIIEQIARADETSNSLGSILGTDYFGVDNYYKIEITSRNNENSLSWTMKSLPSNFGDRDLRFVNDPSAITDWSGAKELWIKIDASEISSSTSIKIAFEENTVGRESYSLQDGKEITLYTTEGKITSTSSNGFVDLPSNFKGYLTLPLNENYYSRYWAEGGNNKLDLNNVVQFQLAVKGDSAMVGKTLYIEDFAIIGDVNGSTLPVTIESADTYKVIWSLDNLTNSKAYNNSSLQWYGEFVGKLLTGMAYSFKLTADEKLKTNAEEIILELSNAQGEDGYLGTYKGNNRYSLSSSNWDLWNQYHCITGLLEWYKLTKNELAFDIAKKCIDCIYETFKNRSYIVAGGFETNRGIAHGYAQMYQITRDEKYIQEAERIIVEDCQDINGWYKTALRQGNFYRSSSNRWEVLHMIMTLGILYEETLNEEYYNVMSIIWEDILNTDIHNSGGFTTNEGAQGNPYLDGVIETCCTIAWLAFTNEYYKYNQSVAVADEFERSYLNGLLGSVLDNGKYCTYNTPMNGVIGTCGHYDGRRVSSQQDISFQYHEGSKDMNCCQANLARGLGQLSEWALVNKENSLYLNYYGGCSIDTLINEKPVTIKQTTTYPLNGAITIEINGLDEPTEFELNLRVPTWAHGSTALINNKRIVLQAGEYYSIKKTWNNGDSLSLNLNLSYKFWSGERNQEGLTSVYRGPILLTLDKNYAPSASQSTVINAYDLEHAALTSGATQGALMFVDVANEDNIVRLVDFASAGKYNGNSQPSTYWSWLTIENAPDPLTDPHDRWMNTNKNIINFNEYVILDQAEYYAGEIVEFRIFNPDNLPISKVNINSSIALKEENGVYSFVMPDYNVEIEVIMKENNNITPPPENTPNLLGTILGVSGAVLFASGLATCIIIKKKKKD